MRCIVDRNCLIYFNSVDEKSLLKKLEEMKDKELFVLNKRFYLKVLMFAKEHNLTILYKNTTRAIEGLETLSKNVKSLKFIDDKDLRDDYDALDTSSRGGEVLDESDRVAKMNYVAATKTGSSILTTSFDKETNEQYRRILGSSYQLSSGLFIRIERSLTSCVPNGCTWVRSRAGNMFLRTCARHR